ncbi:Putative NAD-dependent epimerase/dehydratase, NAD(P)-binding domain superfamily [Colletotrichum destructivum]|uniref:NAD-dependent epimerase/dehydratase, NAD(P)-binding domain superfamily n=1 Tax=Colletotrichum destructivum TaxID=34406 RepID=A0AAX4J0C6_9PEZI|nr:Putative NAD-dependent epimerase/dehydratase, NAD(P)-binding domain superfamily [Colletotrichum destructivum]
MVHILLTGAAGYIGGTILADLLARQDGPVKAARLFAAVRTQEQVELLSKLAGVSVAQVDLLRKDAVEDYVHRNEIDFIVNLAPSFDLIVVSNLLGALGKRRQDGANDLRLVNSSVTAAFSKENGWPFGEISDTGPVIAKEREIGDQHPVRVVRLKILQTNVDPPKANIEARQTSWLLKRGRNWESRRILSSSQTCVNGRGTGQGRKQSVSIPTYVRVSIRNQIVNKFDQDGHPAAAHVTDLAALYVLLIEKILQGDPIPSDEVGIYFGVAYTMSWWKVMSAIARALHSRGLVKDLEPQFWPSYDTAADELGWPRAYIRGMGASSPQLIPRNADKIGWKPEWDESRFMESIDDEVQDALDLDTGTTSLYDSVQASKS